MTIITKYRAVCTACEAQIEIGAPVNWKRGIKGVTCASCPPPVEAATPTEAATSERELVATVRRLATQVAELQAANRATAEVIVALLRRYDNDQLATLEAIRAIEASVPAASTPVATATPDDDCPI